MKKSYWNMRLTKKSDKPSLKRELEVMKFSSKKNQKKKCQKNLKMHQIYSDRCGMEQTLRNIK